MPAPRGWSVPAASPAAAAATASPAPASAPLESADSLERSTGTALSGLTAGLRRQQEAESQASEGVDLIGMQDIRTAKHIPCVALSTTQRSVNVTCQLTSDHTSLRITQRCHPPACRPVARHAASAHALRRQEREPVHPRRRGPSAGVAGATAVGAGRQGRRPPRVAGGLCVSKDGADPREVCGGGPRLGRRRQQPASWRTQSEGHPGTACFSECLTGNRLPPCALQLITYECACSLLSQQAAVYATPAADSVPS